MKALPLCLALFAAQLVTESALASPAPTTTAHRSNDGDRRAIEALLANYTRCVTQGDEAGFRDMLLDDRIPFSDVATTPATNAPVDLRQYEAFRKAVFASGQHFRQRFSNIHIEQNGPLAQVSLDFVTERVSGKPESAAGWKVLQLVKIGDRWKIASELYTF